MPDSPAEYDIPSDNTLLILDDDGPFRNRLGRALTSRGFEITAVETVAEAKEIAKANPPAFAVLDMRLEDGNGLDVVDALHESRADCKMVMLTGYGNLATAVAAVKAGAVDYLAKPADADDVCKKPFWRRGGKRLSRPKTPCLLTACAGNTYKGYMSCAGKMSARPPDGSICTAGHYSEF